LFVAEVAIIVLLRSYQGAFVLSLEPNI